MCVAAVVVVAVRLRDVVDCVGGLSSYAAVSGTCFFAACILF